MLMVPCYHDVVEENKKRLKEEVHLRYYDITVGDLHYTSLGGPSGVYNPGSLNVEIDILLNAQDVAATGSHVKIWGPGMQDISQANDLNNQPVTVMGGMQAGLPLANPAEAGYLASGTVQQAFGNWIGTDQTLEFFITGTSLPPAQGSGGANPLPSTRNIVLNWMQGQDLSQPLQQALQQAFPDHTVNMMIGSYTAMSDQPHFAGTVEQIASHLRQYTQYLMGAQTPQATSPQGVGIHFEPDGQTITVGDGSQPQEGGMINYQDLIGQPTWIGVDRLSIKTVMRGDIRILQQLTLPQTIVTNQFGSGTGGGTTASGAPQTSLTFQGNVLVQGIHHVGNFRQPDAASWCTIFEATVVR